MVMIMARKIYPDIYILHIDHAVETNNNGNYPMISKQSRNYCCSTVADVLNSGYSIHIDVSYCE